MLQILGNVENYHASISLNFQTQILTSSKTIENPLQKRVHSLHNCLFVLHKQNREMNLIALSKSNTYRIKHSYVPTHETNPVFIERASSEGLAEKKKNVASKRKRKRVRRKIEGHDVFYDEI